MGKVVSRFHVLRTPVFLKFLRLPWKWWNYERQVEFRGERFKTPSWGVGGIHTEATWGYVVPVVTEGEIFRVHHLEPS